MSRLRITVSGAGSLVGQAVLKSLRHESSGIDAKIQGLDYFPDAFGFRWCDETVVLQDMLAKTVTHETWLAALVDSIRRFSSRYLFVGTDFELVPLALHRDAIEAQTGCKVIVSRADLVERLRDKLSTFELLVANGLDAPMSLDGVSTDFDAARRRLGTPFVVKPRRGSRSRGMEVVATEEAFEAAVARCEAPVLQEHLGDDRQEFSCGVNALDGAVDTVLVLRRQLRDGNTWTASSGDFPVIEDYCRRIGTALQPLGPINVQLRLEKGQPKAFEINPRFSGTTYFRTLLGVNEVARLIAFHEGRPLPAAPRLRIGTVRRFFDEVVESSP